MDKGCEEEDEDEDEAEAEAEAANEESKEIIPFFMDGIPKSC